LKWSEVNLETKTVWVDGSEAKGKKAISVPLSSKAYGLLSELDKKKEGPFVFTFNGKPVKSIKTAFNKALDRAGLEDVTFHTLRHTFASWAVQRGVPLVVLKELGGWQSLEMVTRYAHLSPDHLRQWVD
jgi:integrase